MMLSIDVAYGLAKILVLASIASPFFFLVCYIIDRKGLRRFPSPPFAGISDLWLLYHHSTGQSFKTIQRVHAKLGSAVRIAPNHISFTDPRAYKDIYGHGPNILKDVFYSNSAHGCPSIALTRDKNEHTRKRKALSYVFSAKGITTMEPRMAIMIRKLCRDLQLKSEGRQISDADAYYPASDGSFDVRPWLNMFAYDAITSMFWSNSYGFLDKGNDLCPSLKGDKVETVHAMDSFHSGGRFNVMFSHLPQSWNTLAELVFHYTHHKQAGINFGGMARHQVVERLKSPPAEPDLFSSFPTTGNSKGVVPMPLNELVAESISMLDAGNDTTQTSLTNTLYLLASHPDTQRKLYRILCESTEAPDVSKPVLSYANQLQHIRFLRAVLDESLRVKPPVSIGLPRRTVASGATVAGRYVPPETTVSVPLYCLHRDESLFRDATKFVPERWLKEDDEERGNWKTTEEEANNLKDYVLPFSLGGRACMGRNLAYMELSMVVASLVLGFEWELAEPGKEMEHVERFNCNPKELLVKANVRDGVNWLTAGEASQDV